MREGIGLPAWGRGLCEGGAMELAVAPGHLLGLDMALAGHKAAEPMGGVDVVCQHGRLLGRVVADQAVGGPPAGEEVAHPGMPEDPVDEVFAQAWVVQPALLLDRQCGHRVDERLGEYAARRPRWPLEAFVPDADAFEAAARRALLEHEAREVPVAQHVRDLAGAAPHGIGVIGAGRSEDADPVAPPHESDGLARNSESDADLGTDRDEPDVGGQLFEQEGVAFVTAVVADLLAQEAGGHADQDLAHAVLAGRSASCPRRRSSARSLALASSITSKSIPRPVSPMKYSNEIGSIRSAWARRSGSRNDRSTRRPTRLRRSATAVFGDA